MTRPRLDWPRGKYNGERITGFSVKFRANVTMWRWLPVVRWNMGQPYAWWLCFGAYFLTEYDP